MNVVVRRAKPSDLSVIQKIATELMISVIPLDPLLEEQWYFSEQGTEYLLRNIRGRNHICLVAEIEKVIIGFATGGLLANETWRPVKRAELGNLAVTAQYRSLGVGHKLVAAFNKWSKSRGAVKVKVIVNANNKDGIRFYEATGFKPYHLTMEADHSRGVISHN